MNVLRKRNVRDLGRNYHGVKVKKKLLIRGKAITRFSRYEVNVLKNHYQVKTILDLRSKAEANAYNKYRDEFIFLSIPVFDGLVPGISHKEVKVTLENLHEVIPEMDVLYYQILHDDSLKNLAKSIQYILRADDKDYAIYFHCAEGKDRTGLIAAILLMILGVEKKEIIKDYLKTNYVNRRKSYRMYLALKYIKRNRKLAKKVRRLYLAKREYIEVLFKVIDEEYHSKETFYKDALHLNDEEIDRFRKRMLEE